MRTNAEPKGPYWFRLNFWKIRGSHRRPSSFSGTRIGLGALGVTALSFVTLLSFSSPSAFAATSPTLGAAATYAVIAGSTITNTGSSVITGDVGLSPGTAIVGLKPGGPGTVTGNQDAADAASLDAQNAATAAYLVAKGETPTGTVAGDVGGSTFTAGVYNSTSSLAVTGPVTLNGQNDPNAVFIFQVGSTLTMATGSSVVLENQAQACNVFWQVGSSATLNTSTTFVGTILALTSATLDTTATVDGAVFAQTGQVQLDTNRITVTPCATPSGTSTTTTTVPATTTTTPPPTTTTFEYVPPTTTTTVPATTTTTVPATTTTTVPATTTTTKVVGTILPVGAPGTGEGGTGGSGSSLLGLIGFGAFGVAAAAASVAVRSRHQRGRDSSSGLTRGS